MNHIFYEIFETLPRVGPGSKEATTRAFNTLTSKGDENILDIGCGTGIHTIQLATLTTGRITALDNHPGFLSKLEERVKEEGLADRIECVKGDMSAMEFEEASFDLIWAEGSIFIMGLANGLKEWKKFLKPSGSLALTDVFLYNPNPPAELRKFWDKTDPGILDTTGAKEVIREAGFKIIDRFCLPQSAWWEDFYTPLEEQLKHFRVKYADNPEGLGLIDSLQWEIDIFRKYNDLYGYIFFLLELE